MKELRIWERFDVKIFHNVCMNLIIEEVDRRNINDLFCTFEASIPTYSKEKEL